MTDPAPNQYQKYFVHLALRRLPHHLGLFLAVKVRAIWFIKILDRYAQKHFINPVSLKGFSMDDLQEYSDVARAATLWHGTGRYQHSDGEIIDVLQEILRGKAIRPVEDAYAVFSGGKVMSSISLTPLRIIARNYADTHGRGYREKNRYGDALMWTSYFYGLFYARMYTRDYFKVRKYYKMWYGLTHDNQGHNLWGKKSNRNARDVWDVFGLGSDIDGNYPVIFGIKKVEDTVRLSPTFADYEVRTPSNVGLNYISHLEVPLKHVCDVKTILKKHLVLLPVLPLELGELQSSRMSFSELLGYIKIQDNA